MKCSCSSKHISKTKNNKGGVRITGTIKQNKKHLHVRNFTYEELKEVMKMYFIEN